jgi:Zn finger protein HypA/HybF involved in hydrogenase expression
MVGTRRERDEMRARQKRRRIVLHFLRFECITCGHWILLERYGTRKGRWSGRCPKCHTNAWKFTRGRNLTPTEAVTAALSEV